MVGLDFWIIRVVWSDIIMIMICLILLIKNYFTLIDKEKENDNLK